MRRTSLTASASMLALALAMAAPAVADKGGNSGNKYDDQNDSRDCFADDGTHVGTITRVGPAKLWPPNHKYVAEDFVALALDADGGDTVELATEGTHEETTDGEEMNGTGNTGDDVSPAADADAAGDEATTAHDLRAERSGRGDGRVYTILYTAAFEDTDMDQGYGVASCSGSFTVEVPHDMRGGRDW